MPLIFVARDNYLKKIISDLYKNMRGLVTPVCNRQAKKEERVHATETKVVAVKG